MTLMVLPSLFLEKQNKGLTVHIKMKRVIICSVLFLATKTMLKG